MAEKIKRALDLVERPLTRATRFLAILSGIAVALMMLHVSADVLMTYLFNSPIVGTLEMVSNYYMVAAIFLPLALVEQSRAHILVELFTAHLGKRAVLACDAFACFLGAVFVGCLTWMSTLEAIRKTLLFDYIDAVYYRIYVFPTRWFVPIGCGLFALYLLLHAVQYALLSCDKTHEEDALEKT